MSEKRERGSGTLTHPDLPEAALAQLEVQAEGLAGDLPGVPRQPLGLGLGHGTHVCQRVTQAVRVLWNETVRARAVTERGLNLLEGDFLLNDNVYKYTLITEFL